jgi:ATP-dependent protease HslVU (ClpYQ) peptidase subunit
MVKQVIPKIAVAVESSLHKAYRGTIGESEVILISHGHAFLIGETLGITKAEPYWAIGSGSHLAMGALAVDKSAADWNKNHASKARVAIGVAQLHDPYTRGNITGYRSDRSGKITKI